MQAISFQAICQIVYKDLKRTSITIDELQKIESEVSKLNDSNIYSDLSDSTVDQCVHAFPEVFTMSKNTVHFNEQVVSSFNHLDMLACYDSYLLNKVVFIVQSILENDNYVY